MQSISFFKHAQHKFTVSRESAPSVENLDSPLTVESSGIANCFFTILLTFSTVSGFACFIAHTVNIIMQKPSALSRKACNKENLQHMKFGATVIF